MWEGFAAPELSPQVLVLRGLGGVGKTSVALEFAHRHAHTYGLVWQFDTAEPATLDAQVGELAMALGVLDGSGEALGRVRRCLTGFQRPWLLILDDVTDPSIVSRLVPPGGPGHVVVTTQRSEWPEGWAIDVPVLERDAAIQYLLGHALDDDEPAAGRLADALGLLPLALTQAGAFLRTTGRTIEEYLGMLSADRARILAHTVPGGHGRAVAAAWNAAVDQIQDSGPGSLALLRLLSCYAPDAVPIRLLIPHALPLPDGIDSAVAEQLAPLCGDGLAIDEALVRLGEYCLITLVPGGAVSVHRLVQATTLDILDSNERAAWQDAAVRLLFRALPTDPESAAQWPACAALLAHAEAVLPAWHPGLLQVARYLGARGNFTAARATAHRTAEARADHDGSQSPGALAARHELARWTGQAGKAAAARDEFAALLPLREKILFPDHPDTLDTRYNLAVWTGTAGDPVAARDQFAALLPIRERTRGDQHPDTLTVRQGLAWWIGEAGDAASARDMYSAALPIVERLFEPEHPQVLVCRKGLAWWTGMAGNATRARNQFTELLPILTRALGPEHPETLSVRHNLAVWTGEAGDAVGARDQLAALLPIRERVLGPEHPQTLDTWHNLAAWSGMAGDAIAARDLYAALLPISERVLGSEHFDTANTKMQLNKWVRRTSSRRAFQAKQRSEFTLSPNLSG